MNGTCQELGPGAYGACNTTANTFEGFSEGVSTALTPIAYTCLYLGGSYTVKGVTKLTDLGVRAVSHCVNKVSKKHFQPEKDMECQNLISNELSESHTVTKEKPSSRWRSIKKNWNSIFKTGRTFGVASLYIFTGITLLNLNHALQANSESFASSCPSFKADAIDSCNWANKWMIDVINEIIQGMF